MKTEEMVPGRKYMHHRKIQIGDRDLEAERWVKYLGKTEKGGLFEFEFEQFELTDTDIQKEIREEWKK